MSYLSGIFNLIPHIIVLIAVILYVKKHATPEGIMMLIGAITGTLFSAFYSIIFPYLAQNGGYDSYQNYFGTLGAVSTLGYLSFAIGLLLTFQKIVADKKQ
jgi:hypothetical protein